MLMLVGNSAICCKEVGACSSDGGSSSGGS